MKKTLLLILILILSLTSMGCMDSQRSIVEYCDNKYSNSSLPCAIEKCTYNNLHGYTGYLPAESDYYQCLYMNELKKGD